MKNALLLLLLNIYTSQVRSLPYQADGNCLNLTTEYKLEGSNLCCRKCRPGERLKEECSKDSETVCEPCPPGQYMENLNYSPNCFTCKKCRSSSGLLSIQNCSAKTMSKCGCKPNMYCVLNDLSCSSCARHRPCKAGYGVSQPGTASSNVRCKKCPEGTFSDKDSSTDPCQPHQRCHGGVIKVGNATADTVCQPGVTESNLQYSTPTKVVSTPSSTLIAGSDSAATPADAAPSISLSASEGFFNHSMRPVMSLISDGNLALAICVPVVILLSAISAILLFCRKTFWRKDAGKLHPQVDANGSCRAGENMNPGYLAETQAMSLMVTSPEQESLLEKSEPSSGISSSSQSQSSRSTDTLTRTENCSISDSIGPLLTTLPLHDPHPDVSEPMTLFSSTEGLPSQSSIHTQSSSLPATPQIISPVTTSPHVNVNITFHIGNGSGETRKVSSADLQADSQLPFGEKEEACGTLQQETGKEYVMAVQETAG